MILDWPVIIPSTGGTCICHVEDVAAATVAALAKGRAGHRYILGGAKLTVRQLAEATLALAGAEQASKPVLAVPSWLLVGLIRVLSFLHLPSPVEPGVLYMAVMYWRARATTRATRAMAPRCHARHGATWRPSGREESFNQSHQCVFVMSFHLPSQVL